MIVRRCRWCPFQVSGADRREMFSAFSALWRHVRSQHSGALAEVIDWPKKKSEGSA